MALLKRNIIWVYVLSIVTFGIYFIWWQVQTKGEINELGAQIPTAWLLIIPFVNIYWLYKYAEGYSTVVKKDNNAGVWFIVFWFANIVMPAIVQSDLNKLAGSAAPAAE